MPEHRAVILDQGKSDMDSVRGAGHRVLVGSDLLLAPPPCLGLVERGWNADGGFDLRGSVLLHLRSGAAHPRIASGRISSFAGCTSLDAGTPFQSGCDLSPRDLNDRRPSSSGAHTLGMVISLQTVISLFRDDANSIYVGALWLDVKQRIVVLRQSGSKQSSRRRRKLHCEPNM
jgi:hypothetical protein